MKPYRIDLSKHDKIILFPICDLHIGSRKSDIKLFQKIRDWILETDNVYTVLGGDIINNSIRDSVGDVCGEITPQQQIDIAVRLLKPLADKGKILWCVSGNHERRTQKQCGIDISYQIAKELGIVDKYDMSGIVPIIKVGKEVYSGYITHGSGSGRTKGAKCNSLERIANLFAHTDFVICGHTHDGVAFQRDRFIVDKTHNKVRPETQVCINSTAFLDYESYAELYSMPLTSKLSPYLIVDGNKKMVSFGSEVLY